ncbi:MAG: hypothetical protein M3461_20855 [Pseudomonadota bacterium]|nr:hypothetical protein [Pseudomonadota bacterium]
MKSSIAAKRRKDLSEPGLGRSAPVIGLTAHIEDANAGEYRGHLDHGAPDGSAWGLIAPALAQAGWIGAEWPGRSAVGAFIATPLGELRHVRHRRNPAQGLGFPEMLWRAVRQCVRTRSFVFFRSFHLKGGDVSRPGHRLPVP